MSRTFTQADIDGVAPGGTLTIDADAKVTQMAEERARSRGVRIERKGGGGASSDRDTVRAVTRAVVSRLGDAGPQVVEAVVAEVLSAMGGGGTDLSIPVTTARGSQMLPVVGNPAPGMDYCLACVEQEKARKRSRAVLTTTGRNSKGIVARVTARIAERGGDILDISQTLVSDFFTMIIVVDVGSLSTSFERFQAEITETVAEMGCQAMMMHEDVLTSLHRV